MSAGEVTKNACMQQRNTVPSLAAHRAIVIVASFFIICLHRFNTVGNCVSLTSISWTDAIRHQKL